MFGKRGKIIIAAVMILTALSVWDILNHPILQDNQEIAPVLAHYYIWWERSRWINGPYVDFPTLGNYSSSDSAVVRQHIILAKSAGITGWIVSWNGNEQRNKALSVLVSQAENENFRFIIWYESLEGDGNRRSISTVHADLEYLIREYSRKKSFQIFRDKLNAILGQSENYSDQELLDIKMKYGSQLLILGSEKDAASYEKRGSYFDGDYYYWSSVDPYTHENYLGKLRLMSDTIHKRGGIWIAPVTPGFDNTPVGGSRIIPRKEGETLIVEYDAALSSNPDAISIISWNEFGENTYIEPSIKHGNYYLVLLSTLISQRTRVSSTSP